MKGPGTALDDRKGFYFLICVTLWIRGWFNPATNGISWCILLKVGYFFDCMWTPGHQAFELQFTSEWSLTRAVLYKVHSTVCIFAVRPFIYCLLSRGKWKYHPLVQWFPQLIRLSWETFRCAVDNFTSLVWKLLFTANNLSSSTPQWQAQH